MYSRLKIQQGHFFTIIAIGVLLLSGGGDLNAQRWEIVTGQPANGSWRVHEYSNGGNGGMLSLSHLPNLIGRPRPYIEMRDLWGVTLFTHVFNGRSNLYPFSGDISEASDGSNDIIWTSAPVEDGLAPPVSDIHVHRMTAAGALVWAKNIGNIAQIDKAMAHTMTQNGDIVVTGYSQAVGATTSTLYIAHLNGGTGALNWHFNYSTPAPTFLKPFAVEENVSTGSITVAGEIASGANRDFILIDVDLLGNVNWANNYGNADPQHARDMQIDWAGNIVVAGFTLTATGPNAYVLKTNSTGGFLRARTYTNPNFTPNLAEAITVNLAKTGYVFSGALLFAPNSNCLAVEIDQNLAVVNQMWYQGEVGVDIHESTIVPAANFPGYYIGGKFAPDNYFVRVRAGLSSGCPNTFDLAEFTTSGNAALPINRANANQDYPRNYNSNNYDVWNYICGPFLKESADEVVAPSPAKGNSILPYPNPVKAGNTFSIRIDTPDDEPVRVILRDALGRAVYSMLHSGRGGDGTIAIPTNGIAPGSYLLQLSHSRGEQQAQVILKP